MELLIYLSALAAGGSILLMVVFVDRMTPEVDATDRAWMDPLPPMLRVIWPLVRLVADTVTPLYSNRYLDSVEEHLQKTGASYLLTGEEFVALRIVSAIICLLLALILVASLHAGQPLLILLLATAGGYFFPLVWLKDTRQRRERDVIRALPVYLDFITMAVEAGLNLTGALQQAMQKAPEGALRNEFATVLRDVRSGVKRADALRRMADRLDIPDVTSFVNAVIQAERMGSSMAAVLRVQAEQRRSERFQRAEKQAMQAPVKLIFPLIVFIFPVTFIVLGFPIAMKFLHQ